MIINMYTIFDKVAQEAGPVFQAVNDAVAVRSCRSALKGVFDINDYVLYNIGTFDTENLRLEGDNLMNAVPWSAEMYEDFKISEVEGVRV